MKKLSLNANLCTACGMCAAECDLFEELPDGKIAITAGGLFPETEISKMQEIIEMCPGQAIAIIDDGESQQKLLLDLKSKINTPLQIPMPDKNSYAFNRDDYSLPILSSPMEYQYKYSSCEKAEREGLSEFKNRIYSQRKTIIQQVVIAFKHNKLLQILKYEENKGNYKFETIKNLENKLREYSIEMQSCSNGTTNWPESFYHFETKDTILLKDFLNVTIDQGWPDRVADELEPADWFDSWINSDDMTTYVQKKGWFSSDTDYEEKDMYCFKLNEVSEKLNSQILDECRNCFPELCDNMLHWELDEFHKMLKEEWCKKIEELSNRLNRIIK